MTLMSIQGEIFSPYSVRGMTQTIEGIDGALASRRTINGTLRNVTADGFADKVKTTLTCEDQESPAYDLLRPGSIHTLYSAVEVAIAGPEPVDAASWDGGSHHPVPGSVRWRDGIIFYRPIIVAMVMTRSISLDEYGAAVSWTVVMEEV